MRVIILFSVLHNTGILLKYQLFIYCPPYAHSRDMAPIASVTASCTPNEELDCWFKCTVCEVGKCHNAGVRTITKFKAKISEELRIRKEKALSFVQ